MGNAAGAAAAGAEGAEGGAQEGSTLVDELVAALRCSEDEARALVAEHGNDQLELLRGLARQEIAAAADETATAAAAQNGATPAPKPAPPAGPAAKVKDRFWRSRNAKEINALRELGFPDVDCVRALRKHGYSESKALKMLVFEYRQRRLTKELKQHAPKAAAAAKAAKAARGPAAKAAAGVHAVKIPSIVTRSAHNARMLKQLKPAKPSPWNLHTIRACVRMKRTLDGVRSSKDSADPDTDVEEFEEEEEGGASAKVVATTAAAPGSRDSTRAPTAVSMLRERLDAFGMGELVMEGDGNCQFRSLSYELFGTQAHHQYVRAQAVRYMKEHGEDFQVLFETPADLNAYLQRMLKPGTWGDELTLKAVAETFGVCVHVVTSTKGTGGFLLEYMPVHNGGGEPGGASSSGRHAFLTYHSPIHYNVMTLRRDDQRERTSMQGLALLSQI